MNKILQRTHVLIISMILTACGASVPVKPAPPAPEPTKQESATAKPDEAKPATPASQSNATKPGGYYLDDGPGDNPPADMENIPDAVPRAEPLLARANKPYYALNKSYQPMTEYAPYKKRGLASWYGKRYHGQKTSTGEIYDMYAMTGAHTTLPIPSYARVTNPANKKSVVVRINDRGPFHSDRIIDLSYVAAYKLGLVGKGSGIVDVEAIDTRNLPSIATTAPVNDTSVSPSEVVTIKPLSIPGATASPAQTTAEPSPATASPPATSAAAKIPSAPNGDASAAASATPSAKGIFVQLGAFKVKANSEALAEKLKKEHLAENATINHWYNDGIYRCELGRLPIGWKPSAVPQKLKHR